MTAMIINDPVEDYPTDPVDRIIRVTQSDSLSVANVYDYCCETVQYPAIVTAQSIQESGWNYESYNATSRNNILGIGGDASMVFDNWKNCVDYYRDRIQSRYSGGNYYEFLERIGYAYDPDYCAKVESIVKRIIEGL